jgi:beta-galactosidase
MGYFHIINFNGNSSVNDIIENDPKYVETEVEKILSSRDFEGVNDKKCAAFRIFVANEIKKAGGVAIMAHPFWEAYGEYNMEYSCDLFDCPEIATASVKSIKPLTMEKVGEGYGYIIYSTKINFKQRGLVLSIDEVHDKSSVYINGKHIGIINRDEKEKLRFDATEDVTYIDILVENLGRINFGKKMETDAKGIIGNVCINDRPIHGFTCTCYPLEKLPQSSGKARAEGIRPAFYRATFNVDEIADTFVYPKNFKRCAVFINGFNIGRYWFTSSFKSLYVPYPLLKKGENEIVIFDAISDDEVKKVEFKAQPSLTGPSRFSDPFGGSFEDNVVKE